ncbi:MAG: M48 family metallopeptidase [Gemmatimonadota bacterium]
MEPSEFEELAKRFDREALEHPRRYRARVRLWGILGYAYIFGTLAALMGLVIGGVALTRALGVSLGSVVWSIGIPVAIVYAGVLKALRIGRFRPDGVRLRRADAPRLFREIDSIRKRLRVPAIRRVLVDGQLNAGVAEIPRLGIFGWHQRCLRIGLLLMLSLSPEEFRAVLAHEMGHLSRAHGRISAWAYQLSLRWERIANELEQRRTNLTMVFSAFFDWYAPRFDAYSYALRRRHEFEADGDAAEIAGREACVSALKRSGIIQRHLTETHWPEVWIQTMNVAEPPPGFFTRFSAGLRDQMPPERAAAWLEQALAQAAAPGDVHPSLAERLAAFGDGEPGRVPPWPDDGAQDAAEYYLGAHAEVVIQECEASWQSDVAEEWRETHEHWLRLRERIKLLESRAASGVISADEEWDLACATAEARGKQAALPVLRRLVERPEPRPEWLYTLGKTLIEGGEIEGIYHLAAAMTAEWRYTVRGCQLIIEYLERNDRENDAAPFRQQLEEHLAEREKARRERETVRPEELIPHDLDAAALETLVSELGSHDDVKHAYLARKELHHLPDSPLYILGLTAKIWTGSASDLATDKAVKRIGRDLEFPASIAFIPLNEKHRKLHERLKTIPGALIYPPDG